MWQKVQQIHGGENFTVVGLALDAEGIKPAKIYYDKFKVTFPSLVDPNYATKFVAVPKTIFIDEHGVVRKNLRGTVGLSKLIKPNNELRPVTATLRAKFSKPGARLLPAAVTALNKQHQADPGDLQTAVHLASRFLDLKRQADAKQVLLTTTRLFDPKKTALGGDSKRIGLLGEAYFQLSRASNGKRKEQVEYATLAFYLKPSIGYGKQIARIIAPEKFDNRPGGGFDNRFREGTLRRLRRDRLEWLKK